jgi:predicted O-methyltransferase YrrM
MAVGTGTKVRGRGAVRDMASRAVSSNRHLHYVKRALRVHLLHFTDGYLDQWRSDRAPLDVDAAARYLHLFDGCETRFTELMRAWGGEHRWPVGRVYNGSFQTVDVELYHSMIRHHRPRHIIEVGGGHSSLFAAEALIRNGDGGHITCIDPDPYYRLPRGVRNIEHIAAKVEEVDVALFEALGPGDILFIDSSHTNDEVQYHLDEILPRLARGVLVQHHDIVFPYANPWIDPTAQDEQGMLLAFYDGERRSFSVLCGAAFLVARFPHLVRRYVSSYRWVPVAIPGSLWTIRT